MTYRFVCPSCGHKEEVVMQMSEYHADGHLCKSCGTEMIRDQQDFCKTYHVNCFGMYADFQSK